MKFGVLASHQYLPSDDLAERLRDLWDLTGRAADLGYDSIFSINHFLGNLQTPQTISVLSRLVEVSDQMTVGTAVLILPLYHPVHIAEEFATLDQMSEGRLVLGVGAGYRRNEMSAFAIDKSARFRQMRESIAVIRKLWAGGPVHHQGEFYSIDGEEVCVKPRQLGGPPIWIGAGGDVAIKKAAELGDAWIVPGNAPSEGWYESRIAMHDAALEMVGKTKDAREYPILLNIHCADSTEKAQHAVRPHIEAEYFKYADYPQLRFQRDRFEFLWNSRFLIGDPDHVAKRIEWFRSLGVNHVVARPFWLGFPHEKTVASVELFAQEVMPRFR